MNYDFLASLAFVNHIRFGLKMAAQSSVARENYLIAASRLLAHSAPVAAAHIRTILHRMDSGQNHHSRDQTSNETCKSCGNALIVDWSCKRAHTNLTPRTRQDRICKSAGKQSIRLECLMCNTINNVACQRPAKPSNNKSIHVLTSGLTEPIEGPNAGEGSTPQAIPQTIAVPRKRLRNKKSSLLSMIANQKAAVAPTSKSGGLDIMDFLKT